MSGIFEVVSYFLDKLSSVSEQQDLKHDEASKYFRNAVVESKLYFSKTINDESRDRNFEGDIAKLWMEAARLIGKSERGKAKSSNDELITLCEEMCFIFTNLSENDLNIVIKKVDDVFDLGKQVAYIDIDINKW